MTRQQLSIHGVYIPELSSCGSLLLFLNATLTCPARFRLATISLNRSKSVMFLRVSLVFSQCNPHLPSTFPLGNHKLESVKVCHVFAGLSCLDLLGPRCLCPL